MWEIITYVVGIALEFFRGLQAVSLCKPVKFTVFSFPVGFSVSWKSKRFSWIIPYTEIKHCVCDSNEGNIVTSSL